VGVEHFVSSCPVYITDNLNKDLGLVNGTKAFYHSMTPASREQQEEILQKTQAAAPGDVVTLSGPPETVNVELESPYDKGKEAALYAKWVASYNNITLVKGKVVIPMGQKRTKRNAWVRTIVSGYKQLYSPSKVHLKSRFPLNMGLVITVFKAQGMTLPRITVALSKRPAAITDFTYEALYVAFSRVKEKDNIPLLLCNGSYDTVTYVTGKKPDQSIVDFFLGYDDNGLWTKERALASMRTTTDNI
jgi:hypothetical protein